MAETNNPFDSCSEQYSKFRPDYPEGLIDYIHSLSRHSLLVDVGAGTGKASAPFAARDVDVVSIEPSLSMIRQGVQSYGNLRYACSVAEELPLASGIAAVVISAQAFHWFDAPLALREFKRILRPGGHICLFWNTRDLRFPAPKLFDSLVHKWNPSHEQSYRMKDWGSLLEQAAHHSFRQVVPMSVDDWIGLSRSISYVQSIGPDKVPQFEKELREGLQQVSALECPYVTELWSARVD